MNLTIKYPDVRVQLTGTNGSGYNLAGLVIRALREAGIPQERIDVFWEEASSEDYDKLLQTCMAWVDVS
jgi:hypothetical protein